MPALNDRIISELQQTEINTLYRLINYMKTERGFFWVRSGEHDHWTNGTAQHSWRVYLYMLYMWEHPEDIPCNRSAESDPSYKVDLALAPEEVKKLTKEEIILTGLLHDVGKMRGCKHHASNSKEILKQYLGNGFFAQYPHVVAAIFFHHHADKDGGELNLYRHSTLQKLLNQADSMASGTTWNSTRFIEQRSQHSGEKTNDIKHMRRVAMDRTRQALKYRMYVDGLYDFHPIVRYNSKDIIWNSHETLVQQVKMGMFVSRQVDGLSGVCQKTKGGDHHISVGIEQGGIKVDERRLRQENPYEEELLICSNILFTLYGSKDIGGHRYAYTMRSEVATHYLQQSSGKGVFLPNVTFFRDGAKGGILICSSMEM